MLEIAGIGMVLFVWAALILSDASVSPTIAPDHESHAIAAAKRAYVAGRIDIATLEYRVEQELARERVFDDDEDPMTEPEPRVRVRHGAARGCPRVYHLSNESRAERFKRPPPDRLRRIG